MWRKIDQTKFLAFFLAFIFIFAHFQPFSLILAAENRQEIIFPKKIRVGWYERSEFQETKENGLRSGYAYEYLQSMATYGGWTYEYVEGSKEECEKMLQEGSIDLLGGIAYNDQTRKDFAFTKEALKETYFVLLVSEEDERYQMDNFSGFQGMRVGVIGDASQKKWLSSFAKEQSISFYEVDYDTTSLAYEALQKREVDAILTSRIESHNYKGKTIAQFGPEKQYFVTRKGDENILQAVDYVLKQIRLLNPEFRIQIENKYFSEYKGNKIAFTKQEMEVLQEIPEIRVTLASFRRPMMYQDGGGYAGIAIDILKRLEEILGVRFVFVEAENQLEAVKLVKEGKADLVSNVFFDFGWAEKNNLLLSKPYMDLDYAALVRIDEIPKIGNLRVAAVKGYLFSEYYIKKNYSEDLITWYNSEEECLKAVVDKQQDICFTNTYVANTYIQDYEYRGLYSSLIPYSHGLSLGAAFGETQTLLISAIDKAIASMSLEEIYTIIAENTMFLHETLAFSELIIRYPITFLILFGVILAVIAASILAFVIYRNNRIKELEIYKAKLAAQRDSITGLYNRLSFELLISENLSKNNLTFGAFMMLDIDDFKTINDTRGHSYGDQVLITLADAMKEFFVGEHLLCRMGGDEFAAFLLNFTSKEALYQKIEEFRLFLREGAKREMPVSCSIGVAVCAEQETDFESLYQTADAALYLAKRSGKNQIQIG